MSEQALNQLDPQLDANASESIPFPAPSAGVSGQLADRVGTAPEPMSMGAVLRVVAMRRLWYAQIVSVLGDFLALFAVITVMTFRLHANAQQITGVQIAYLLPIALLGIISGVFVDRWPIKTTMVSSDFIRAALVLLLLLVHNVYGFYAVLAGISIVSSFFSPAQGVAIRTAVPLHGLRSANALLQQAMFIMRIIGPSAAAFLVASFGAKSCYLLDTASFIASGSLIASLTLIVPKKAAGVSSAEAEAFDTASQTMTSETGTGQTMPSQTKGMARVLSGLTEDMKEGAGFILHHAALLFVIVALAAGMFVMGCFGPLIAVYVRDTLHASTRTFGVTSAMIGFGLLIGVNALNALAKHVKNTTQVYFGLGGIAFGTALLAGVTHIAAAILGCFVIGFAAAGIIVPSQTLIQEETPAELMGRVGSTVMSAIFTAQIAGLILSGILAEHTSVRRVFAICTAMLAGLITAGKLWMEPKDHPALA